VDDRLRQRLSRLGDGKGIDNWHSLPAHLGRSIGEEIVPVRAGMERRKNIEVHTNRRFKRQGREGAEHLAQLLWLQTHRKIGPTGGTKLP